MSEISKSDRAFAEIVLGEWMDKEQAKLRVEESPWGASRLVAKARALRDAELVAMAGWDGEEFVAAYRAHPSFLANGFLSFHEFVALIAPRIAALQAKLEATQASLAKERRSYRCYCCKAVFEEDNGYGSAAEHFGRDSVETRTKCAEFLDRRVGGGPHDPVVRALGVTQAKLEAAERERDRLYDQILDRLGEAAHALIQKKPGIALDIIEEARAALGGDNG